MFSLSTDPILSNPGPVFNGSEISSVLCATISDSAWCQHVQTTVFQLVTAHVGGHFNIHKSVKYPAGGKIYGGKFDCSNVVVKSEPAGYFDRAEAAGPRDPQSIEDAIELFSDPDYCLKYLAFRRWPDGRVRCPACGSANVAWLAGRRIWECRARHAHAQFSVRSGTFLEDSRVSLCQWLTALWLMAEHNRGISSYEVARRIGVTQKSAWLMMKRVRRALDVSGLSLNQFSGDRISGDRVSGQSLANGV